MRNPMDPPTYLVTGVAGFVGSALVRKLNRLGAIVVGVDDLALGGDPQNIRSLSLIELISPRNPDLFRRLATRDFAGVCHQGAITDTLCRNREYFRRFNTDFTLRLASFARDRRIRFVYASSAAVYGNQSGPAGELRPLTEYAESKVEVDRQLPQLANPQSVEAPVGLRYFNVYGGREGHKGRMASMLYQTCLHLITRGYVELFEPAPGGEPFRRDWVCVRDVVRLNMHFLLGRGHGGIFDVGTGESRSFCEVAQIAAATLGTGTIRHIPFPAELRGRYQSHTRAQIDGLRGAGYAGEFQRIEQGIPEVLRCLQQQLR